MRTFVVVCVAAVLVAFTLACATPAEGSTTVNVDLHDGYLSPSSTTIQSGQITFVAHNVGTKEHELRISQWAIDDSAPRDLMGQIQPLAPGETGSITLGLPPGDYEMSCQIVEGEGDTSLNHYDLGEKSRFTVQ